MIWLTTHAMKSSLGKWGLVFLFTTILTILVSDSAFACPSCVHFTSCISGSDNSGTVLIPAGAPIIHTDGDFTPEAGDEFAVFRPNDDLCAGAIVWVGPTANDALTVWGDSSVTPQIDGMLPGEVMRWHVWDASTGFEYAATVEYDPTGIFWDNGEYGAGRIYSLAVFEPTAINLFDYSVDSTGNVVAVPIIAAFILLIGLTVLAERRQAHKSGLRDNG